ncbi:MAG: PQQ-like beta-propeller repeat protein [Planctomycetes bacterium]|nr:PQQ-like beta-propeller repeat protein [Planctomycetota bacterium]
MSSVIAESSPKKRSWKRRFAAPLIALTVPIFLLVLLILWDRFDWDPAAQMPLGMAFFFSMLLAIVVIVIWWLFFSGFSWLTRLSVFCVILAVPIGASRIIRKVDFKGNMTPVFFFVWQDSPGAHFGSSMAPRGEQDGLPAIDLSISAQDFPRYRGVNVDGHAYAPFLATDWVSQPPKVLWKQPCGGGYSGFAVAGNVAVTIEQIGGDEAVICYDRDTGRERWRFAYPASFEQTPNMGGDGPRSTPTIADGDVYSLGAKGDFVCLEGATGKPRWKTNILDDAKAEILTWGMTGSPLIVGDMVIVNPGIALEKNFGKAVVAYDRKTGNIRWANGTLKAGYSSPQLAKLAGVEQIVLFDGAALTGISPKDGKRLWEQFWHTFQDMNIVQPVVLSGDRVFISTETTNGCAMFKVSEDGGKFSVIEVWKNRRMYSRFANPVAHNGHIYGLTNGKLVCLADDTGVQKWKDGDYGSGQLLITGDTLIISDESGTVHLVAADPTQFRELAQLEVLNSKTWNTPALAGQQLFVRNHLGMACLELPRK